jgi:tRNA (cytidine32/uridine32-2'-O)-methyltransferase
MALDDIRIVLIEPAHPGNIGAVARAMKTMSLTRLVLVRPDRFPSADADRRAMGAIDILKQAQLVDGIDQAIGDCRLVIGGSARERTFPHPILDARQCGARLVEETSGGEPAALVFGPERTGLSNHDLDRCTYQVLIPTSEAFSSLNLASAVQLVCYEIFLAAREPSTREQGKRGEPSSRQAEMEYFFGHLERALDSRGFLDGQMREITMMKLRRLFGRSRPNAGELKLLHTLTRFMHRGGE